MALDRRPTTAHVIHTHVYKFRHDFWLAVNSDGKTAVGENRLAALKALRDKGVEINRVVFYPSLNPPAITAVFLSELLQEGRQLNGTDTAQDSLQGPAT